MEALSARNRITLTTAALCTLAFVQTSWSQRPAPPSDSKPNPRLRGQEQPGRHAQPVKKQGASMNSLRAPTGAGSGNQGGIAGGSALIENFEAGWSYGAGCGQNGWVGYCGPNGIDGFQIVDDPEATYGNFSARHNSDATGFAGFEVQSPQAPATTGIAEVDLYITDTTSLYQLITINQEAGGFFNTRLNFEANGTITALQTTDCAVGFFDPTTGTWAPNTITRIGIEVPGDGTINVYQDGVLIYTGQDIASQCAGGTGMTAVWIFAANTTNTASMVMDNFGDPCLAPLPCPCHADIEPVGGNGVVNVSDLLRVIATWGQTGPPRPQGDVFPLPLGNCFVNVQDLLEVIRNWGACQVAQGACCFVSDGSCVADQTEADCIAAGGLWQGCRSECKDVVCPAVPDNDNCIDAIDLGSGTVQATYDNTYASTDGPAEPSCDKFGDAPTILNDVWYTWTATVDGTAVFELCGSSYDTKMAVYDGFDCVAPVLAGCDDDSAGCGPGTRSRVVIAATAGQTYTVRAGSWTTTGAGVVGQGVLDIYQPICGNGVIEFGEECDDGNKTPNDGCTACQNDPPPNDPCETPIDLGSALGSTGFNNVDATTDGQDTACDKFADGANVYKDLWYTWTAPADGNAVFDLCSSSFDSKIAVYLGHDCLNMAANELGCDDDAPECGSPNGFVAIPATSGQLYTIRVGTWSGGLGGNGVLNIAMPPCGDGVVELGETCDDGNSTPDDGCTNCQWDIPDNDECTGAIGLSLGANGPYTNNGATDSPEPNPTCSTFAVDVTRDVWFVHVPTCDGIVTIDACSTTGSLDDTVIAVYASCKDALGGVELGCDDDNCVGAGNELRSSATFAASAFEDYYIRVGSWGTGAANQGEIFLNVSTCAAPIPGDMCDDAIDLGTGPVTTSYDNSQATTDGPPQPECDKFGDAPTIVKDLWFTWTAHDSGNAIFATCGSSYDTKIAIYSGDCSLLVLENCDDDSDLCGVPTHSAAEVAVNMGQTYLVRVGSYSSASSGAGQLQIEIPVCGNGIVETGEQCDDGNSDPNDGCNLCLVTPGSDECAGATQVFDGDTTVSNSGASLSPEPAPDCVVGGDAQFGRDVWYTYTATCNGNLTVNTCNGTGSFGDSILAAYASCADAMADNEISCNDDSCGLRSNMTFPVTAGQTVLIRLASWGTTATNEGVTVLSISCNTALANDQCSGATPIFDGPNPVNNVGATTNTPGAGCGIISSDIWFTYEATCTGTVNMQTCDGTGIADTVLAAYADCAAAAVAGGQIVCDDDACPVDGNSPFGYESNITFGVTAGTTYVIRFGSWGTGGPQGDSTITVTCTPGP